MKTPQITFKKTAIALALVALLGAQTTVYSRTTAPGPEVTVDTATVTVNVSNSDTLIKVVIRVPLSDGTVEERVSKTSTVAFDATGLADGKYLYEAWALLSNSDGKYTTDNSRGSFVVSGGSIVQAPAANAIERQEDDETSLINDVKDAMKKASIATLDFLISPASAVNLTAESANPTVFFDDSSDSSGNADRDWYIVATDTATIADFRIVDDIETPGWNNTTVFEIQHPDVGKSTANSFLADDQGNVSLAGGDFFLNRASGKMGLGTTTPTQGIHGKYSGKAGLIRMEDTTESTWDFGQSGSGDFLVSIAENGNGGPTGARFIIKDQTGNVGVGTTSPDTVMHVAGSGATTAVLTVEDTDGSGLPRTAVKLINKGPVGFGMEDKNLGVTWDFRTNGLGHFIMNDVGDGAEAVLSRVGDLTISGTLTEGSSRDIKTDITSLKTNDFMDKLSKVEVLEWRYKGADRTDRHIGPIAEDFYKLFKLGPDNKHISPRDVASIALLAAKELQKKAGITSVKLEKETVALKSENIVFKKQLEERTTHLKFENLALKKELESQKERLASLEKLLTNLVSANGALEGKGKKVALSSE